VDYNPGQTNNIYILGILGLYNNQPEWSVISGES
jgi:hypothetical protein